MSMEIARTTLDMALQLVAQQAGQQRQILEAQASIARGAMDSQEVVAQLVQATVANLGQLINVYA